MSNFGESLQLALFYASLIGKKQITVDTRILISSLLSDKRIEEIKNDGYSDAILIGKGDKPITIEDLQDFSGKVETLLDFSRENKNRYLFFEEVREIALGKGTHYEFKWGS